MATDRFRLVGRRSPIVLIGGCRLKPLDINFAGGKFRYLRARTAQTSRLAGWLTVGGVLCSAGLAMTAYLQLQERSALSATAATLAPRDLTQQPRESKSGNNLGPAQIDAINAAINKLNIPWRDLFDALEQATPDTIALISLEPGSAKNTLRLVAEASGPAPMLDYLARLKALPLFANVRLTRHEINAQDPNFPYRFQLEARWRESVR